MKNQIECPHFEKESRKTNIYIYKLIGAELNLCMKCEKKLREQIFEQIKIENETSNLYN